MSPISYELQDTYMARKVKPNFVPSALPPILEFDALPNSSQSESSDRTIQTLVNFAITSASKDYSLAIVQREILQKTLKNEINKNFLLFQALLWEICCCHVSEIEKRKLLFNELSTGFHKMGFTGWSYQLIELEPIRNNIQSALNSYILQWKQKLSAKINYPGLVHHHQLMNCSVCAEENRFENEFIDYGPIETGGFGVVHKVQRKFDKGWYAVKIIRFQHRSENFLTKIMREVHLYATLPAHPNIVVYKTAWLKNVCIHETLKSKNATWLSINEASEEERRGEQIESQDDWIAFEDSENSKIRMKCSQSKNDGKKTDIKVNEKSYDELVVVKNPDFNDCLNVRKVSYGAALYIQMELCGKDLKTYLRKRNDKIYKSYKTLALALNEINFESIITIFRNILEGVKFIHLQGLIHRDLKPRNIMFSLDNSTVKIGDFGLATMKNTMYFKEDSLMSETSENKNKILDLTAGLGTTIYAAPEQQTSANYDNKVDIYSLGIILFELSCPYRTEMEKDKLIQNLKKQIIPQLLHEKYPSISNLILHMIDKNPKQRPSASDILNSKIFKKFENQIEFLEEENKILNLQLSEERKRFKSLLLQKESELVKKEQEIKSLKNQLKKLIHRDDNL